MIYVVYCRGAVCVDEKMLPFQNWEKMLQCEKNCSELEHIYMFPPMLCAPFAVDGPVLPDCTPA